MFQKGFIVIIIYFLAYWDHTLAYSPKERQNPEIELSPRISPITDKNIFRDSSFYHWCGSIIKGPDKKYHMIYSRWHKQKTFLGWLTKSTIAHAVSDQPEGPYRYVNTCLDFEQPIYQEGDFITAHNPKIEFFNGKYYLYFISTKADGKITSEELDAVSRQGYGAPVWKTLRKNQRTYVAEADHINGPWTIHRKPLLQPSGPIATLVVNPAVTKGKNGLFYLIVKGDKPGVGNRQRNQAIAISQHPDRDFVLQPKPMIEDWDTEDVSLWYDNQVQRYYAVFHAHSYIGFMTSADGLNWTKARNFKILEKNISRSDGKPNLIPDRMERPFVYVEQNVPKVLLTAILKDGDSSIVTIPLHDDPEK